MDREVSKAVPRAWRTVAVALVGIIAGGAVVALSPAFGKGGGGTLSGKTHVDVKIASLSPTSPSHLTTLMKCPKGNVALGGGVDFQDPDAQVKVTSNGPVIGTSKGLADAGPGLSPAAKAWKVHVINQSDPPTGYTYAVGVICGNVK
jgi:hypothetical protein